MGVMPSSAWKRKVLKQPWYGGETLIAGIGQGYVLTTPLQLATITATLANNGFQMQPHMLRGTHELGSTTMVAKKPAVGRRVPVANSANWSTAISSMVSVVHSPRGSAYGIGVKSPYKIAGKTGTAQVASIKQGERYKESETPERLRDHALFVAFAPVEDPQIAIAVIIENGGHGSSAAAPVARTMMDYYLRDLVEAALNKQSISMPAQTPAKALTPAIEPAPPAPAPQPHVTSGPLL